jgi:hypothetical protein
MRVNSEHEGELEVAKPGVLRRFRPQMTEAITCRGENRGATMRFVEDAA